MIVLLIILVVGAIGGVAAYVIMQATGFTTDHGESTPRLGSRWEGGPRGGALSERIADAPSGCLVAVLVAMAVWIAMWTVVLVLGLRVVTA